MTTTTIPAATVRMSMSETASGEASSGSGAESKDSSVECPTCGRTDFESQRGVEVHHSMVHDERLADETVPCDFCGEDVDVKRKDRKRYDSHYCSTECQHKGYSYTEQNHETDRHLVECFQCGEELERTPHRLEKSDKHFCDSSCYGGYLSKNIHGENHPSWKGGGVEVDCHECGETIKKPKEDLWGHDRTFCGESCRLTWLSEYRRGENNPRWAGGAQKYYGPNWQEQRRDALNRDNHICQSCGITAEQHKDQDGGDLHVHHIQKIRSFETGGGIDFESANALENLISLCRDCHNKWEGIPIAPERG